MVPERRLAPRRAVRPILHPRLRGYNPLDILTMGYFGVTALFLALGHNHIPMRATYLAIHVAVVVFVALLGFVPRRGNIFLMFLRDTYTLWALPFLYKELGILNQTLRPGYFDSVVLGWEKAIFGLYPSLYLRDWIPSHPLSEFLHFSYLTYYALVPILGFWLYLRGRDDVARVFATSTMLTFFTCYIVFILFPVAGPYYVFPHEHRETGFFARLVYRIIDSGASRGTAFPSSHVAGAVTVFCMTIRFEKPLIPLMGILCAGIFFGTVYGGFHYGVDALTGLTVGVSISLLGPRVHSFLLRRARLRPLRIRFPHLFRPLVAQLWSLRKPSGRVSSRRRAI